MCVGGLVASLGSSHGAPSAHLTTVVTIKRVSSHCLVSLRGQNQPPVENHLPENYQKEMKPKEHYHKASVILKLIFW